MDPIKEARKAEKREAARLKEQVYREKMLALAEEGVEFMPFPKIPRLNRDITITEKIDGTNGAIGITGDPFRGYTVYAQSRGRIITPENDNAGFAAWVEQNKAALAPVLGAGLHFGEWWGKGIQRGYGQTRKFFSLFNFERWSNNMEVAALSTIGLMVVPVLYHGPWMAVVGRNGLETYPHVDEHGKATGGMLRYAPDIALELLATRGSIAAPDYKGIPVDLEGHSVEEQTRMIEEGYISGRTRAGVLYHRDTGPEGIIVFHKAGDLLFKATLENDEQRKSEARMADERIMDELEQELNNWGDMVMATAKEVATAAALRKMADELDPPAKVGEWKVDEHFPGEGRLGLLHPDGYYWAYFDSGKFSNAAKRMQLLADALNKHKILLDAPKFV